MIKANFPEFKYSAIQVDPNKLYLVADLSRPGTSLFAVRLEYTHFPPRSEKNKDFEVTLIKWPEDIEILWSIIAVPMQYRSIVEEVAANAGLRLAEGTPMMFGSSGEHLFPVQGNNVYTLENIKNHPVYTASEQDLINLKEAESKEVDAILDADIQKIYHEMSIEGYSKEQIDRIMRQWALGDETYDEIPQNKKS